MCYITLHLGSWNLPNTQTQIYLFIFDFLCHSLIEGRNHAGRRRNSGKFAKISMILNGG